MEYLRPTAKAKVLKVHKVSAKLVDLFRLSPGYEITSSGAENLPTESFIAAFTHHNSHDFIGLGYDLLRHDRGPARLVAKEDLFDSPLQAWLINAYGGLPINRENADFGQMLTAARLAKEGQILGIAPEAARISGDRLAKLAKGVGYIAVMAQKPVVPVGIAGQNWIKNDRARWYIPRSLHVHYGEPIKPEPVDLNLDGLTSLRDMPKTIRHAAHNVNKQLQTGLEAAFEAGYGEYAQIHGPRAAARLDRTPTP